jgi:hypothetical protein
MPQGARLYERLHYDDDSNGSEDVFVTKINPAGTALIYSTYIGGSDDEGGLGIALDSNDRAYVTGYTRSYTDRKSKRCIIVGLKLSDLWYNG